jgi:predicted nuclease of restriction endonuclease-like (RecB) superfamily
MRRRVERNSKRKKKPKGQAAERRLIVQQAAAQLGRPPKGYPKFLADLKTRIAEARARASLSANRELIVLYWQIGRDIRGRQRKEGWGAQVIDRLAHDLGRAFPEMKGFSVRNLQYMRKFAEAYPRPSIVQQVAAQIPWFHNCILMDRIKSLKEREWYISQTVENGWSRNVLVHQIESGLYRRQGKALTNFARTLPRPHGDLVRETLKDPYVFNFLSLGREAEERDLQQALIQNLRDFLLELGVGFAFVGSQYHLEVGGDDFYLDLLFYHIRLRCYVAIELKTGAFQPEFAGKMNFYLTSLDRQLREKGDQPSIGLILCKQQNRLVAEYALHEMKKPVGVSTYRLTETLPARLQASLPSPRQLAQELEKVK